MSTNKPIMPAHDVRATMHFLERSSFPYLEKPYLLRLDEKNGLDSTNYSLQSEEISIKDVRPILGQLNFEEHGFAVLQQPLPLQYAEFDDGDKIESTYLNAVLEAVRAYLKADSAVIIPHTIDSATAMSTFGTQRADGVSTALYKIRRRHPMFPMSTGELYEFEQPTNIAHVDVTAYELSKVVEKTFDAVSSATAGLKRHQWVNIWQPLRGPLSDWPLALCLKNAGCDEAHHKTEAVDVVFPDRVQDVELAYFSKEQNWFYLSNQVPEECLLFLQGEVSLQGGKTREGLTHASFENKNCRSDEPPRESIEVKLLVSYKE